MKRIGSFLIVAALIAVMAGCSFSDGGGDDNGDNGESYVLTIISTAGGSVTTPGEGVFTCDAGDTVNLSAEPEEGCEFVNWTGSVDTVANVTATSTGVTTNSHCSIRATFSGNTSCPIGLNYTEAEAEELIIDLINDERQLLSLSTLSEDALLTGLAWEHSISMVENDFFGHERYPGERDFTYEQPYGTTRGENLAKIPTRQVIPGPYLSLQEVCEWAVSDWMDSPTHKANIEKSCYTKTGVGVSFSDDWDYIYITQIFEGAI
jgi:uncharacterized protein YkwD